MAREDFWLARDESGELNLFEGEPTDLKMGNQGTKFWSGAFSCRVGCLYPGLFPEIKPGQKRKAVIRVQ